MKRLLSILVWMSVLTLFAQRPVTPSMIRIMVGDTSFEMSSATTQTEVKPGWKIVDYKLPDKATRYLWGHGSNQVSEDGRPVFLIRPEGYVLSDFAIIKLVQKKQYRKLPSPNLRDCDIIRVDLDFAKIELVGEDQFRVTPIKPLRPGEYILVNLAGKPVNNMGDIEVFPFAVSR